MYDHFNFYYCDFEKDFFDLLLFLLLFFGVGVLIFDFVLLCLGSAVD